MVSPEFRGTTFYVFDALNRLSKVTDPDEGITSYAYDNAGNRKLIIYPNGTRSEYFYDSLNRLVSIDNRDASNALISGYTYTLGNSGNRIKVTENSGRAVNYTYDSLYRLVSEQISDPVKGNENIGYTYDAFGNRLTKTDSSGTTSYVYDANDRLVTESGVSGATAYSYDANGNTLSKTGSDSASYEYNAENRLVSVNNSVGQTEYQYDASGIRVSSNVNGTATKYLVDKNRDYAQVLEERTGSGTLEARYTYGDDLISQNRSGSSSFYIYDGQLSTRQLTDSSGAVTDTYTYDAFGVQLSKTGTTLNNYRYTGEQFDPNAGFYYLRARYYDQSAGRFLTVDPWKGNVFEPLSLHKYMYVNANPINKNDPTGYFAFSIGEVMTSMAVSYALTSVVLPDILNMRRMAMGHTNEFSLQFFAGGSAGDILYGGMIHAYIWEKKPYAGKRERGLFQVTLLGFGIGGGATIVSSEVDFKTHSNRRLENFVGYGRISALEFSAYFSGSSFGEMQLADGTRLSPEISPISGLLITGGGAGGYVVLTHWSLLSKELI